jgi:hypothetical protein
MTVRREVLVFVILGACAWLVGLGMGEAMRRVEVDAERAKMEKIIEHDPPVAFDIRRAG